MVAKRNGGGEVLGRVRIRVPFPLPSYPAITLITLAPVLAVITPAAPEARDRVGRDSRLGSERDGTAEEIHRGKLGSTAWWWWEEEPKVEEKKNPRENRGVPW